jgi:hypothetical protein
MKPRRKVQGSARARRVWLERLARLGQRAA